MLDGNRNLFGETGADKTAGANGVTVADDANGFSRRDDLTFLRLLGRS